MKLSLVVPCYNEEGNIRAFYTEAKEYLMQKIMNTRLSLSMMEVRIKHRKNLRRYTIFMKQTL